MTPFVGSTETDPSTGAVALLMVVEADLWISTLTIPNPSTNFTASTVTVVCADSTDTVSRHLSAIGETCANHVLYLLFVSSADEVLCMLWS